MTTSDFMDLGITKPSIQNYVSHGLIEKIGHGIYMDKKQFEDEYYVLQMRYPNAIFSFNTAFHILGLTNRTPSIIDITVPRNKRVRGNYNVHRVSNNYYKLGIIEVTTPYGNPVKIYNAERSICDMLRTAGSFDLELQNRILNNYFKSKEKNIDELLEYAKTFNIYEKVNAIVEVTMKW